MTPSTKPTAPTSPSSTVGLGQTIDREYLQRVALRTGGVFQEPDPEQLTQLFQNVLTQLKQQYVLVYASTVPDLQTSHRVVVRVKTAGDQATDGTTFGAAPASPQPQAIAGVEEKVEEVIGEEKEDLLTRARNYVEDNTRNVALGAGGIVAVVLVAALLLRRRRARAECCPTCGRELPADGICPYCEGWSGEFEMEAPPAYAEPPPPPRETMPGRRPTVPPTVHEVGPTVHVEPPARPPAEGPPVDKTRVIQRPPKHVGLFVVKQGPQPGARFEVSRQVTGLGRTEGNDIRLDHPTVSREHARVRLEEDTFVIYDLGSANDTKVNGVLIEEPQPLKDGDEVQLGNVVLTFKVIA